MRLAVGDVEIDGLAVGRAMHAAVLDQAADAQAPAVRHVLGREIGRAVEEHEIVAQDAEHQRRRAGRAAPAPPARDKDGGACASSRRLAARAARVRAGGGDTAPTPSIAKPAEHHDRDAIGRPDEHAHSRPSRETDRCSAISSRRAARSARSISRARARRACASAPAAASTKNRVKPSAMMSSGHSIDAAMVGPPRRKTLAG